MKTLVLIVAAAAQCHAAGLHAGVATTDITPRGSEIMWGFEDWTTPANGTIDPLYARVLVLEAGAKRLALVTLDLGRACGPASMQHLRDSAACSSKISCLLASASHTPTARPSFATSIPASCPSGSGLRARQDRPMR
jgi:hypothetical protein